MVWRTYRLNQCKMWSYHHMGNADGLIGFVIIYFLV